MADVMDDVMDQAGERFSPQAGRVDSGKAADGGVTTKPTRAPRKKDPKLDLDLLEADGGFNDIWHKMAPAFKASFQGEGHEVADLRRLLELYQRWQMRFYPHCDFDTFITKLEKAGRSKMVKAKMGSMRQNLLGLIFPEEHPEPVAAARGEDGVLAEERAVNAAAAAAQQVPNPVVGARTSAGPVAPGAAGALGRAMAGGEDEDDELVALQREAEWEAAYAAMDELEVVPPPKQQLQQHQQPHNGGGPAAAAGAVDDMDMEELMQLAEEMHGPPPRPTAATPLSSQVQVANDLGVSALKNSPFGAMDGDGEDGKVLNHPDEDEELLMLALEDTIAPPTEAAAVLVAQVRVSRNGEAAATSGGGAASGADGGGGASTASDLQDAPMEDVDEDEELRLLAAMDTVEAEAAVSLRHDVIPRALSAARSAPEEEAAAADGGPQELCVREYGGTEELDAELLALAAAETQVTQGLNYVRSRAHVSEVPPPVGSCTRDGNGGYGSNVKEVALDQEASNAVIAYSSGPSGGSNGVAVGVASMGYAAQGHGVEDVAELDRFVTGRNTRGSGLDLQSTVQDSQGMETGMALRDILMTQTQTQDDEDESM